MRAAAGKNQKQEGGGSRRSASQGCRAVPLYLVPTRCGVHGLSDCCAGRRRARNLPRLPRLLHLIAIEYNAPVQPAGAPRQVRPSQGRRRSGGAQPGGCSCVLHSVLCCAVLVACKPLWHGLCCACPRLRSPGQGVGRLLSMMSEPACCASASEQHPRHALMQAWDTLNNPIKKRAYDAYGGCFHLLASAP